MISRFANPQLIIFRQRQARQEWRVIKWREQKSYFPRKSFSTRFNRNSCFWVIPHAFQGEDFIPRVRRHQTLHWRMYCIGNCVFALANVLRHRRSLRYKSSSVKTRWKLRHNSPEIYCRTEILIMFYELSFPAWMGKSSASRQPNGIISNNKKLRSQNKKFSQLTTRRQLPQRVKNRKWDLWKFVSARS